MLGRLLGILVCVGMLAVGSKMVLDARMFVAAVGDTKATRLFKAMEKPAFLELQKKMTGRDPYPSVEQMAKARAMIAGNIEARANRGVLLLATGAFGLLLIVAVPLLGAMTRVESVDAEPRRGPVARIVLMSVFTFGIGVALYGLQGAVALLVDEGRHVLTGRIVEAKVVRRELVPDPTQSGVERALLHVVYDDVVLRPQKAVVYQSRGSAERFWKGDTLRISVVSDRPRRGILVEEIRTPLEIILPATWRVVLILVGLAGILRNWEGGPRPSLRMPGHAAADGGGPKGL